MGDNGTRGPTDATGSGETAGRDGGERGSIGRRNFLRATGAGAFATSVAGCLGGGGGGDDASVPLSDRDEVRVGVLAPVPSENPIGASIANGVRLAATEINDGGGIGGDGPTVSVTVKDTKEQPQTGSTRYGELVRDEEVDLTAGIFTSEVLLAILDDIAEAQTPHMTTGAASPEASAQVNEDYEQYKYHFRTGPINAHHLGVNLVEFVDGKSDELGWESVAVLVEDFKWTEPVSAVLDDRLADAGVDVAMNNRYAAGTEDFNPIYNDVEDSGADAAFIAMAHTGTAAVLQWAQQQRPFEFGGIHVPMQLPSYYGAVGGACAYGVTQNSATPQAEVTDQTVPFANAFQQEYGSYPVYTGYISYDAMHQYASVVAESGDLGADAVVDALEGSSYTGTVGTIEYYGPDHEFAHDVVYGEETVWPLYQQWQPEDPANPQAGGTQEVIFPEDLQTADYQSPPWV